MNPTPVKLKVLSALADDGGTCADLARKIGKHRSEVSNVLSGRRCTPDTQQKLAKALGMSVGELFGDWAWFRRAARKLAQRERERAAG